MIHGGNVWQGNSPAQWLDYSANIRPEGAPDWVKDALMGAMDKLSYYPDQEMKRARQSLSAYLDLPAEYVLPTAGGISAINLATHLPGTGMLQFTPCFAEYSMLSENRGKTIGNIPLLTGRHIIGDPVEQAKGRLFEGCTVWLCNPLNPIGCAFTVEQIEKLLMLVEEKHGWLVVDEAFIEYCPDHSAVGLTQKHERLLVTGSMTKILGIPGVRLGYLCAQPQVLVEIGKYQLTWEVSCFAEAVLCALPKYKVDVQAYCEVNACRREHLRKGLEGLGVYVYPSEAAFVLADFGNPVHRLIEKLKERGILVRQCMNFEGVNNGCHLRLAVKDESSNDRLIEAIREEMICAENL
ncbi:MAG: histidinol-phosphate aminotransferase family protein [Clostridia bacterium]|nr:histidinol-phosphate aminotransferase family protein [Clostridia bacterium]